MAEFAEIANINATHEIDDSTILFTAVRFSDVKMIKLLFTHKANLYHKNKKG